MESVLQRLERGESPSQLDEIFIADHQALEVTFRRLMAKMDGGDPDAVRAAWCALDRELEAHLRAEEQYLLPRFSAAYPAEAARIQEEHNQIRAMLLQLGVDLDLHMLRAESAALFIAALRQHAKSEERVFYRWAQTHVPHTEHALITGALRALKNALQAREPSESRKPWRKERP